MTNSQMVQILARAIGSLENKRDDGTITMDESALLNSLYETLFIQDPKEVTMEELTALLGYEIKIIK